MARVRVRTVVLWVLLVLLVAVGVLGVSLSMSTSSMMAKIDAANEATDRLDEELGSFDMGAAADTIEEVSALWKEVNEEAHGWQWNVARYVPVLGNDVDCLQRAAGIADRLSNDAVMPVVEQMKALGEGMDLDVVTLLTNKAVQLESLMETLGVSRNVVAACREEADALPTATLTQVNDVVSDLKEQVGGIDDVLAQIDSVIDIAGSFVSPTSTAAA